MPDDDKGDVACLGELHDPCGTFAYLREATDGRFNGFCSDSLDRVDDHYLGFEFFDLV